MDSKELAQKAHYYVTQLEGEPYEWLRRRGLDARTIRRSGLGYVPNKGGLVRYGHSISIPYWSPDGTARGIRFRYLNPSGHKYDSLKGVKIHLYNVAATTQNNVWICEGEFDSLILNQLGYPSVGIAGTNGFKPPWKYLFSTCDTVTIVMDGDEPGQKAAARLASILGEVVPTVKLARLPNGQDVTDLAQRDVAALRRLVE